MPYIPVPNTAQLEMVYSWDGQVVQNVLHYVKASPWDIAQLEALSDVCIAKFGTALDSILPTTLTLIQVRAIDMSSETAEVYTNTAGLPLAGTNVSPSMPNNVALCITKRTALRGRSYRGRIYHPGLVDAYVTNSTVNSDAVTGIITAWNAYLTHDIGEDDANLCVVSRYTNGNPRSEGVANLVTNLTSDGKVDSQRRRLPGRGR